jgi:dethiobiotin synthetase
MTALFVTGAGTGIGKTFVTVLLCRQLREHGQRVVALKPVISGFDDRASEESDTGLLLKAQGLPVTAEEVARVSPWRFAAPLAPNMAARHEGRDIDMDALIGFCRERVAVSDAIVLIEGVGGVMVPLTERETVLDWIAALKIPAVLVTGSYLGSLSHGLTAAYALSTRDVPIAGVVVSESAESPVPLADTTAALAQLLSGVNVVPLPRLGARPEAWRSAPDLTPLVMGALGTG